MLLVNYSVINNTKNNEQENFSYIRYKECVVLDPLAITFCNLQYPFKVVSSTVGLFVCPSARLFVCSLVCMFVCLSVLLFVCLSVVCHRNLQTVEYIIKIPNHFFPLMFCIELFLRLLYFGPPDKMGNNELNDRHRISTTYLSYISTSYYSSSVLFITLMQYYVGIYFIRTKIRLH